MNSHLVSQTLGCSKSLSPLSLEGTESNPLATGPILLSQVPRAPSNPTPHIHHSLWPLLSLLCNNTNTNTHSHAPLTRHTLNGREIKKHIATKKKKQTNRKLRRTGGSLRSFGSERTGGRHLKRRSPARRSRGACGHPICPPTSRKTGRKAPLCPSSATRPPATSWI